ncbi:MAG: outer-membrane lipoprotein carrier protein LolA [Hyphomicrobiales bacterium]|nr:outer-membrane lipoprotein carrier protein LolA [Hyphomicrobiales bacterium]
MMRAGCGTWIAAVGAALIAVAASASPAISQGSQHGKTTPPAPAAEPAPPPAAAPTAPAPAPAAAPAPAEPKSPNPVGAGWDAKTQPATPQESAQLASDAVAVVNAISAYFNNTSSMQGQFVQTDADNTQKRGRFYFERPGKVRFDYSTPSKQKIISDGKYLAIEDHDLKTSDRYPLDSTPFRLLLAPDVNFLRDARIISLDEGPDVTILTLEDKSTDAAGQIRLFFTKPGLVLKEWLITDAQGLTTKIELQNLELNKTVSADLFKFSDIGLPNFRN